MTLLEQAREAVRASRNFEPAGEHFTPAESETMTRLCRDAYLACKDAGVTIGQMRLALFQEERAAHRAKLEAICTEFNAATLARAGKEAA
jgi:hypothetical protein